MKVRGKEPNLGNKSHRWGVLTCAVLAGVILLLGLLYFSRSSSTKFQKTPENTGNSRIFTAKARADKQLRQAKNAALGNKNGKIYF